MHLYRSGEHVGQGAAVGEALPAETGPQATQGEDQVRHYVETQGVVVVRTVVGGKGILVMR